MPIDGAHPLRRPPAPEVRRARATSVLALVVLAVAGAGAAAAHTPHAARGEGTEAGVVASAAAVTAPAPPWCGSARRSDDTTHAAFAGAPTIKVVYAHRAARPSRLAHFAPILEANAAIIARAVSEAAGGRKTVRFDRGTACGPAFLDIQSVRLRGPASRYRGDDGLPTVEDGTALNAELRRALRGQRAQKFLVFADGLQPPGDEVASGQTDDLPQDPRRSPRNAANLGGNLAVVFGRDGAPPPASASGFESGLFLHELLHTLGAVQASAPHATAGGHCFDGSDVMCYRDRTARSALYTDRSCAERPGPIRQHLDCGGDDYFNPAPPPGSYLARHWNVYDSAYLVACTDPRAAPACAPGPPAPRPAGRPAGPAAEAGVLPVHGGAALGAATVELALAETTLTAHGGSTPLALGEGEHRVETCLSVTGAGQSAPWRDCIAEDVEEARARAPVASVELALPSEPGSVVAVEVRVLAPDGSGGWRTVAASAPAAAEIPVR